VKPQTAGVWGAATVAVLLALAQSIGAGGTNGAGVTAPRAPERLADTGLYADGRPDTIDPRNQPFSPQYPLWSDGAAKRRWVRLPPGAAIDAADPAAWEFPVGTKLWKEFTFDGRRVETRLLWRASEAQWVAVSYQWNAEGTEATLAPEEGVPGAAPLPDGRFHAIPSRSDCAACHGARLRPLGFTALQLSDDRDPQALHGEPLEPGMVTLAQLVRDGRLVPARSGTAGAPPRIRTASPRTRRALGYLLANCGSCHGRAGEIANVEPFFTERDLLADGDAVARGLAGRITAWAAPAREAHTMLVDPGDPDASALLLRMRSRRPSSQMPPLGTVVRDQAAVDAIAEWIRAELSPQAAPTRARRAP
jgi:mono/diheme cytochrome c family protein